MMTDTIANVSADECVVSAFRRHVVTTLKAGTPLYDMRGMKIFCIAEPMRALILDTDTYTYWDLDEFDMIDKFLREENIELLLVNNVIVSYSNPHTGEHLDTNMIPTQKGKFPIWISGDPCEISLVPTKGEKILVNIEKMHLPRRCTYNNVRSILKRHQ